MWRTTGSDAEPAEPAETADTPGNQHLEAPDTKRLLLVWAPLVAAVTVMCAVCLLCSAPPSPLRSALEHRADAVLGPWHSESWSHFGPRVPEERTPAASGREIELRARFAHRQGEPGTRK